ncbi:YopX family protein [Brevibacillus sp. B_LB10_24]|uniref:YopX family protein n=1 Tax=Brevibacillus sp. B_LB10_24 TaxID=3380645 RepID=UPI0038BCFD11
MQAGREIKFRALHKSGKMLFFNGDSPSFGSYPGERFASVEDVFYYHKEDFQLMQYTGLHDKNGKEIYEGDHMYASGNLYGEEYIGTVVWDKDDARFEVVGLHGRFEYIPGECYVKGNIYENPELLEVGK